ncbi:MAG: hypothetical protein R3B06_25760 [Kofleriaceae bacterium]
MRIAVVTAIVVGVAGSAGAEPPRALRVSADAVLPLPAWDQRAGLGLGGSVAVAVALTPTIDVTARVGVVSHLGVAAGGVTTRVLEAPIVGGARYRAVDRGRAQGFVFGEVGLVATRTTVTAGALGDHQSAVRFAAALGGGVAYRRVDLRVAAWLADLADRDHGVGVTAAIGVELIRW